MRHAAHSERAGERRRVLPDQHGAGDPREAGRQRANPAVLGDAAGDPDHAVVAAQRARSGVRVGGLAVVDEVDPVDVAHSLLAVRQAWEALDAARDRVVRDAERAGHRDDGGRVLRVVLAGECRIPPHPTLFPEGDRVSLLPFPHQGRGPG